jgi:putative acetyltransferase
MKDQPSFRPLTGRLSPESQTIVMLARVWRAARQKHLQFLNELHSEEEDREHLADVVLPTHHVWVAEVKGEIAGFIAFGDGWVHHLYVTPESQKQGIGAALLAIAKRNYRSLQLWVFQSNLPAIRFYEREAFCVVERTDGASNEARKPDIRMCWLKEDS